MIGGDDVSIIICAYTEERWDDLVASLESIHSQTLMPKEIIVVVDHNPALLARVEKHVAAEWAISARAIPVRATPNSHPRGLSGARNSGIDIAAGEIIAFIDEDAIAAPDWLAQLIKPYQDPQVLGVGGSIDPMWLGGRPAWFPEEFNWVVGCTYVGMPNSAAPVRNLIGCNMSFRRQVFAKVGGFRNGVGRVGKRPVGCEETELCIRISQQWTQALLIYEPQARVHHRVPISRACWHYFHSRCYSEGLSKAKVATLVGARDGLSNEWGYTLYTLPMGSLRALVDALLRRQISGMARAGAITVGLIVTTIGYLRGVIAERRQTNMEPHTFRGGLFS